MSSKLLYSLTDETPDLHKQIGCMNGIFQLFDRHHFLAGRRTSHKRLPPEGQSGNYKKETNKVVNKGKDKNRDKQRNSSESSRTSFSSSSCSSTFSSLECQKIAQLETPSITHPLKTPSRDLHVNPLNASFQRRGSLDLRDAVKDSINREPRRLLVKTANKDEAAGHTLKYVDSPRPLQLSKSAKPRISNINESSQAFAKFREATRNSNEAKDYRLSLPKDAPRFSYDGRELREKSITKLKELPRLSLDSRENSIRRSSDLKSNYFVKNQMENGSTKKTLDSQEEPGSYKRPSSVVAKLMGLDALPEFMSANESNMELSKPCPDRNLDPFTRSSSTASEIHQNHIIGSPRNCQNETLSSRPRSADSFMKPPPTSKISVEPAPWKQPDRSRGSQKPATKYQEVSIKSQNSSMSVYGEIEKRLADLEFKKSNKDLRALKQIIEAMQKAKETSETKKYEALDSLSQTCSSSLSYSNCDHSSKLANQRNLRNKTPIPSTIKQADPLKTHGSPIVLIKPAIRKSSNPASSMIAIEGLSGLHKLRTGDLSKSREDLADKQISKDRTPRGNLKGTSNRPYSPMEKNFSASRIRTPQTSKVPQQVTAESPTNTSRSSASQSPRLQRKQLELEKQPQRVTPSTDSNRARRQYSRQQTEVHSPGRKLRLKSPNFQQSDDQLSEISSSTRCLSHHSDAISSKSESNISFSSNIDIEVASTAYSEEVNSTFFQQGDQKDKNPASRWREEGSPAELATATPEQPSPVSVLDAMFYKDDLPSPVKNISIAFKDDEILYSDEPVWTSLERDHISNSTKSILSFVDNRKLENIEQLIQKIRQLNSPHDDACVDYITPILENKKEDHSYIFEILLASGLLSRDLSSGILSSQIQPTGHLINPDLFLVLEQTNAEQFSSDDHSKKNSRSKHRERIHRKLVFDVVNEVLVHKLVPIGSTEPRFLPNKLAGRIPTGQQLLQELCSEIDCLQASSDSSLEDDDDIFRSILWEDLRHQSPNWTDFSGEVSGLVLDVERLIFKDLVTEVVNDEAEDIRGRLGGHCRKLFSK